MSVTLQFPAKLNFLDKVECFLGNSSVFFILEAFEIMLTLLINLTDWAEPEVSEEKAALLAVRANLNIERSTSGRLHETTKLSQRCNLMHNFHDMKSRTQICKWDKQKYVFTD